MAEIGIRELRDHLSGYLERVRNGEEVVVTDRGRAVARVVPIDGERAIDRLVRKGRVLRATRRKRPSAPPLSTGAVVSDLLAEQRR
jgi:prevent-host-death family protein